MKLEISRQVFEKYSDMRFNENPSGGSQVVPCGRTDMTEPIVAFCKLKLLVAVIFEHRTFE
jgi:hypothetical protein